MTDDVFEKVDLPSGGWVAFRDPQDLTERERRPVKEAQFLLGAMFNRVGDADHHLTAEDIAPYFTTDEALTMALTQEWSFNGPVTLDALRDLKGRDYDTLTRAAAKHLSTLLPNFRDVGDVDDPESAANPTGPSSD